MFSLYNDQVFIRYASVQFVAAGSNASDAVNKASQLLEEIESFQKRSQKENENEIDEYKKTRDNYLYDMLREDVERLEIYNEKHKQSKGRAEIEAMQEEVDTVRNRIHRKMRQAEEGAFKVVFKRDLQKDDLIPYLSTVQEVVEIINKVKKRA